MDSATTKMLAGWVETSGGVEKAVAWAMRNMRGLRFTRSQWRAMLTAAVA